MGRKKAKGPYIHLLSSWPRMTWDAAALMGDLLKVRNLQGRVFGRLELVGFDLRDEAQLRAVTLDVIKSSEIEGELLGAEQVRSSVARRLGLEVGGLVPSDRFVDGVVDMMLDATQRCHEPLTVERLYGWHSSLFPTGRSGMHKITVGAWRDGPMQVVSGGFGREKVHFEAPGAALVPDEMSRFLEWYNADDGTDLVLKAGVAHLWFLTIHPFEDGNGRIARAASDLLLARSDEAGQRFYSMSAQIRLQRAAYYDMLEMSQSSGLDITPWLGWFLRCLQQALLSTDEILSTVLRKHHFWARHAGADLNERQRKLIGLLLEGFDGKLTSSKWAKIAKCSQDTALRDIQGLLDQGILGRETAGGRSTAYLLQHPA
jgi:Fic family protein